MPSPWNKAAGVYLEIREKFQGLRKDLALRDKRFSPPVLEFSPHFRAGCEPCASPKDKGEKCGRKSRNLKKKGMFFPGNCSSKAELCLARSWAELAFPGPPDWSPGNPKLCSQLGLTPSRNAPAAEDLQGPVSHNLTDTEEPMDPRWCPGEAHGSWIVSRKSPSIPDSVWEKPMDHGWCPGGACGCQKVSRRSLWMPEGVREESMDARLCQEEPMDPGRFPGGAHGSWMVSGGAQELFLLPGACFGQALEPWIGI